MKLSKDTVVVVTDGRKLHMFRQTGDESRLALAAMPDPHIAANIDGSGGGHRSSAANPDNNQQAEDGFTAGVADYLNAQVLSHKLTSLVIVAAPKTLGELRQHYHKQLKAILEGELSKDLAGLPLLEIQTALENA